MKNFLIKSTLLTIIVFTVGVVVYSTVFNKFYLPILPVILVFFYVLTNLVHAYLLKLAVKSSSRFTSQYMATSFLKMFFYLAVAIVYVVINKDNAKTFLINYLLLYTVFTSLEVFEFSKIVRQKNK
jgi:hypothetical protein